MDAVRFEKLSLVGLERVDAPIAVSSEAIEERLSPAMRRAGYSSGLLYQLTGIQERRLWRRGVMPSEAAARAGQKALEQSGVDAAQIGVMVSTSVGKDFIEPSVASLVHHRLGLSSKCLNFDIGNACLGFINGIQVVGDMIERGLVDYGLVVNGESSREVLDATVERLNNGEDGEAKIREELATLTLGSGAAAAVLGPKNRHDGAPSVVGAVTRAATEHNDLCRGQRTWMKTDAAQLLVQGLALAERTFKAAGKHLGWGPGWLDHVAAHQVSATHTARVAEQLGIEADRFCKIFGEYGNVGPASIPIAVTRLREGGAIEKGDRVGLMGIGSGLNCAMMELQW